MSTPRYRNGGWSGGGPEPPQRHPTLPPHLEQLRRLGAKCKRLAQVERTKVGVKRLVELEEGGAGAVGAGRGAPRAHPSPMPFPLPSLTSSSSMLYRIHSLANEDAARAASSATAARRRRPGTMGTTCGERAGGMWAASGVATPSQVCRNHIKAFTSATAGGRSMAGGRKGKRRRYKGLASRGDAAGRAIAQRAWRETGVQ